MQKEPDIDVIPQFVNFDALLTPLSLSILICHMRIVMPAWLYRLVGRGHHHLYY